MSKVYDGIMGLIVGDALGVPFEFLERDTFKVTDMTGYGTYRQPPGTWSDDSSMTIATVESIGRLGKIDINDIMENFCKWCDKEEFTPYGTVFDIGGTTRRSIQRYMGGTEPLKCGGESIYDNGNGSLMRILPIAFVPHTDEDIDNVSKITHAHRISLTACRIYIKAAEQINEGKNIKAILSENEMYINEFSNIPNLYKYNRDDIKSSGYVVDTLEAAFWCLLNTNSYRDCVLTAVNLGEDTDTVAAVAGGLAGIIYGCGGQKGIPERWIEQVARKDWIKELCTKMTFEN